MHADKKIIQENLESCENNSDDGKLGVSEDQKGFKCEQCGKVFGNLRGEQIHTAKIVKTN